MKNTINNLILSVLNIKDPNYVKNKVELIEGQLLLNEVEKKIIKDIKESLVLDKVMSIEFLKEKYAYYVEADKNIFPIMFDKDAIDSAITDIKVKQLKSKLSKDMLEFGSKLSTLQPEEIKDRFNLLHSNALLETRVKTIDNALQVKEDAYKEATESRDGLSLCLPKVEEYAGKAAKGTMVSILAFTGAFKSTYALNIAYENAINKHNILYLSLESTSIKMVERLVLNHIATKAKDSKELINSYWLRDKMLDKKQQKFYNNKHNEMIEELDNHLILWDSTQFSYETFLDMQDTLRHADKVFKDKTGKGLDGVVVDQLSLLKYSRGSGKKVTYDGALLNDWVSFFAKQMLNFLDEARQITVFMVSQVNRDAYAEASKPKKKGRYDAACASDSHELERSSSTMITLYKDLDTANTILINIPKARDGFMPDNPIQTYAYGEYFHIGKLSVEDQNISIERFEDLDFDLKDLL